MVPVKGRQGAAGEQPALQDVLPNVDSMSYGRAYTNCHMYMRVRADASSLNLQYSQLKMLILNQGKAENTFA